MSLDESRQACDCYCPNMGHGHTQWCANGPRSKPAAVRAPRTRESQGFCAVCNAMDHRQDAHRDVEPVRVTLLFENPADRDHFMGQLTDGWGENEANVRPALFHPDVYTAKPFPMYPDEVFDV